jgi:hypothetical protein
MNELSEIKMDIHNKYCELIEYGDRNVKAITVILDTLELLRSEINSLRTDVDKLIENNNGGKCYGRTA